MAGLGLLTGCGRLPVQVQASERVYRVGLLAPPSVSLYYDVLLKALGNLGYEQARNLAIEQRLLPGESAGLSDAAAELVALPVDLIFTATSPHTQAAKAATTTVPIVFAGVGDPVGQGVVASLGRPGGNVTGSSNNVTGLTSKRVELLKEIVPDATRLAVLWNSGNPAATRSASEVGSAAEALTMQLRNLEVRGDADFEGAFAAATQDGAQGLVVVPDPLTVGHQRMIAERTLQIGLPSILDRKEYALAGGLMSYGPDQSAEFRRAATYIDRILKGAKPADLPVEQPREFEFVINLKTAQALGLAIPQQVLLQATEVLQ
jgi:putative ABC transport system substrate-binding protein